MAKRKDDPALVDAVIRAASMCANCCYNLGSRSTDRCRFLRERGFTIDAGCKVPDMGEVLWIERGPTTAWLAVKDGMVRPCQIFRQRPMNPQVVEWLTLKEVEPEKPKAKQRSMFDD